MALDTPRTSDTPEVREDPRGRLLGALASECRELGLEANVITVASSSVPPVLVVERLAIAKEVIVDRRLVGQEAIPGYRWTYTWSWGDEIGPCDDPKAAAWLVAAVLGRRPML